MNKARILIGFAKTLLVANIIIANLVLMLLLSMPIINTVDYIYLIFIPIFLFGFFMVFLTEYVLEIRD